MLIESVSRQDCTHFILNLCLEGRVEMIQVKVPNQMSKEYSHFDFLLQDIAVSVSDADEVRPGQNGRRYDFIFKSGKLKGQNLVGWGLLY